MRKHRDVLRKMSVNVGKKGRNSISQAARDAGYSESYARSGRLQKTKTWQQLVKDELSDETLLKVHTSLLNSNDWRAKRDGLHFAYKIKGRYNKELLLKHELSHFSDEELNEKKMELIAEIMKKIVK